MPRWLDVLVFRTWWEFRPNESPWVTWPYHLFNLFEGCAWVVFAALVLWRARTGGGSALEGWYALAFFTFGVTDFREASALTSWLIWVKLANLLVLWKLRALVIARYYPESRLY